jgi:clan AA aspartic protease (TIGR02281 family)
MKQYISIGLLLASMSTQCFSSNLLNDQKDGGRKPAAAKQAPELTVYENKGSFYIPCVVNGKAKKFVYDTGASQTTIPFEMCAAYGIKTAGLVFNIPTNTANGLTYSAVSTIGSLTVDGLRTFQNASVMIAAQQKLHEPLLGLDLIKCFRIEQVAQKLTFRNLNPNEEPPVRAGQATVAAKLVLECGVDQSNRFNVPGLINGKAVSLVYDPQKDTTIPFELCATLGIPTAGLHYDEPYETGYGPVMCAEVIVKSLQINGTMAFQNFPILVYPKTYEKFGYLGGDVLTNLPHIVTEKVLRFYK